MITGKPKEILKESLDGEGTTQDFCRGCIAQAAGKITAVINRTGEMFVNLLLQ